MTVSGENQIVGVGSRNGRIKQFQCVFPGFVIGFVLLLLSLRLRQPSFHLIVNGGVVGGIRTLFSLDRNVLRF